MKINWNQKYTTIAVYSFCVIALSIIFYLILSGFERISSGMGNAFSVMYPFVHGFVIAYLVNYPLKFFSRQLNKIERLKKSRIHILALLLAYLVSGLLIYLFFTFMLPQLIASISGLIRNIPAYIYSTTVYIQNLSNEILIPPEAINFINDRWIELAALINEFTADLVPRVVSFLGNTARSFFNLFLGIIISVYMLVEKNRFISLTKKAIYSIFNEKASDLIIKISRRSHNIFGDFLGGKILDSAIVGVIAFVVLSIVNMPYALLVSFIIGVTNIIPFFGPFIGAIPSFFIIFFESPIKALWFVVIIIILQQVDGNIIGPKILGDSLGISSFWILFSIIISGRIFGFIGMVIGVPLFVLIYSIVSEILNERLREKGLPVKTSEYLHK